MSVENSDIGDEWRFTLDSDKSCSRKPHSYHHVTSALVGSRSNNTMTTMIQVTANSTMHQPHPDVSDDNDVDRSCIMHLVYTVLRPKMGVSLSEFDEQRFVMLKENWGRWRWGPMFIDHTCILHICWQTLPPSNVCSYLIGAISKTFVVNIFV